MMVVLRGKIIEGSNREEGNCDGCNGLERQVTSYIMGDVLKVCRGDRKGGNMLQDDGTSGGSSRCY
jgi:hypothetical protein